MQHVSTPSWIIAKHHLRWLTVLLLISATVADSILTWTGTIEPINSVVTRKVNDFQHPWLNIPMMGFTYLGTDPVLFMVVAVIAFWLVRHRRAFDATLFVGASITARILGLVAKYAFRDPRPLLIQPPWPLFIH